MKSNKWILLFAAFMLFAAIPAQAHYVWLDESGLVEANSGDAVTVDVYLHTDIDDTIYGFGLNIGFDDAAVDGTELQYQSFTYGTQVAAALGTDEGEGYLAGESKLSAGDATVHAGLYDWNFIGTDVSADTDTLLFSVNFTFTDGIWDGEDAWVEFDHMEGPNYSYFDLESEYLESLPVEPGPDYAPVPIPGALVLFASGLLGVMGIRRKK